MSVKIERIKRAILAGKAKSVSINPSLTWNCAAGEITGIPVSYDHLQVYIKITHVASSLDDSFDVGDVEGFFYSNFE